MEKVKFNAFTPEEMKELREKYYVRMSKHRPKPPETREVCFHCGQSLPAGPVSVER